MGKFFKRMRENRRRLNQIEENLQTIAESIKNLDQKMNEQSNRPVNVEQINVDNLENLIFRLESLDINELSGTLNIGNNFKSTEDSFDDFKMSLKEEKKESKEKPQSQHDHKDGDSIKYTDKGLSYRRH